MRVCYTKNDNKTDNKNSQEPGIMVIFKRPAKMLS